VWRRELRYSQKWSGKKVLPFVQDSKKGEKELEMSTGVMLLALRQLSCVVEPWDLERVAA
jgi:hypothetical protein